MKDKSFGNLLLEARQREKISQYALSQKLHISRQSISNWENDYSIPDLDMLKKICQILNMDYNEISQMSQFSNKTKNKAKNKLAVLLVMVIVFLIILNFILIKFRTKLIVYDVFIEPNDKISLNNGIFIKTNSNYYFKLGTIKLSDDNINDYRVRIYYKTNDSIRLLIESNYNENIFIDENHGYEELFDNELDKLSIYIDLISLKDPKITSTFKLEFKKILQNKKIFNIKAPKISKKDDSDPSVKRFVSEESLKKHDYKLDFDKYVKKNQKGTFQFSTFSNILFFFNDTINLEYNLTDNTFIGTEYDYDKKMFIIDFVFYEDSKQLTCHSDSCDNYKNYINILKDEINLLTN